jgi:RND family efflux transporter MFP subunit
MHKILTFLKSHVVLASTIVLVAVAGTAIAGRVASRKAAPPADTNLKQVTLVEAGTFRTGLSTVAADGVVEAVSQVDLRSQVSAPLSSINFSIGDTVAAGSVIAEMQNADIRAQLEQARASLTLAESQLGSSEVNLESARRTLLERIRDSFSKGDNAVNAQIEDILYRETANPEVGTISSLHDLLPNRFQDDIINTHDLLQDQTLPEWKEQIDTLTINSSNSELLSALKLSRKNLETISGLLDNLSVAINEVSQDAPLFLVAVTSSWKSTVDTARTTISGSISSLTAAEAGLVGSGASQVSSADAQISAARAGVKNLEAQLAKTIIRSPITGKIAALPLRTGELASPGQLIATVVGSGSLQIKAYASGEDFARIQKNARATIEGKVPAIVTSVAPSVNQENKKLEVKLSVINSQASGLVVGQNVQALIESSNKVNTTSTATYLLPMQNVKIVPGDAYVLTVDDQSKIVRHPVVLGEIRGEFVEVKSGLTDTLKIVTPVYELNEGESVRIQ